MRYHYIPIRKSKREIITTSRADKGEEMGHSQIAYGRVKWYSHSGKSFGSFLKKKKDKHATIYHPTIVILGINSRGMKTYIHTL